MSKQLPIPPAALTQHVIALGKTRSGKSSKLRVCAEHLLEAQLPLGIVDVKGDWWGIKSSADGKRGGFPLVIFGGEHADVPINEHSGAHVAEIVATGNRPYLIDLGGWMVGERTRFFIAFASTLFKLTKGTRYLVLPECHNFAPKGKIYDPEAGKCLHWANRLASEGQGKGLILLADSQRPQKVHNDFLTSCETLIACRVVHKADRDAIKDWVDGCADPAAGKQMLGELAQMQRTDAWVWSPEISFGPERITWPMFKTYDSFKPQAASSGKLKGWAEVDLDDVKAKLVSVVEEAKANDPKALKARVAELERDLATAKKANAGAGNDEDAAYSKGVTAGHAEGYKRGATDMFDRMREKITAAAKLFEVARDAISDMYRPITDLQAIAPPSERPLASGGIVKPRAYVVGRDGPEYFVPLKSATADSHARRMRSPEPVRAAPAAVRRNGEVGGGSLPKGERLLLTAVAQFGGTPVEQEQLFVLTGYKSRSITEYASRLRGKGYLSDSWPITATQAGIDALGPAFEPLPTGDALFQHWKQRLPSGELRVLEVIASHYPDGINNADIGERTEYASRSVTEYVSRLKARRLVQRQGGVVKASAELFA